MSNISTAYDAIKARMIALFPEASGYVQLVNPYDVEENTALALKKGWGISFGSGLNTNRQLSCRLSVQRAMIITFTRERYRSEFQIESQETSEKLLFEDQFILIKDLEKEVTINNAVSGITRFVFASDGGVESVGDTDSTIKLVTVFDMEYFENLTP